MVLFNNFHFVPTEDLHPTRLVAMDSTCAWVIDTPMDPNFWCQSPSFQVVETMILKCQFNSSFMYDGIKYYFFAADRIISSWQ